MRRQLVLALGGACALAAVYFLGREGATPPQVRGGGQAAAPQDLGFVAVDAQVSQTGGDGLPLYRLDAARIVQSPDSGDVAAQGLRMTYEPRDARGRPLRGDGGWVLTARAATLPAGGTRIRLAGDVRVTGTPRGAAQPLVVRTEALVYDTVGKNASTRLPVTFNWGPQQLAGRGMHANLRRGQLELDSEVHGSFAR